MLEHRSMELPAKRPIGARHSDYFYGPSGFSVGELRVKRVPTGGAHARYGALSAGLGIGGTVVCGAGGPVGRSQAGRSLGRASAGGDVAMSAVQSVAVVLRPCRRADLAAPRHVPVRNLFACPDAAGELPGARRAQRVGSVGRGPQPVYLADGAIDHRRDASVLDGERGL